jgi:hypothetical protein
VTTGENDLPKMRTKRWRCFARKAVSETVVSYVLTAELHFALYRQIYGEANEKKHAK